MIAIVCEHEEWYGDVIMCPECNCLFMYHVDVETELPSFCPHCGKKFHGYQKENETVINFKKGE